MTWNLSIYADFHTLHEGKFLCDIRAWICEVRQDWQFDAQVFKRRPVGVVLESVVDSW